jgi:hypothetical protein
MPRLDARGNRVLPRVRWRQAEPERAGGTSEAREVVVKVARLAGDDREPFEDPIATEHTYVIGPQKWRTRRQKSRSRWAKLDKDGNGLVQRPG